MTHQTVIGAFDMSRARLLQLLLVPSGPPFVLWERTYN